MICSFGSQEVNIGFAKSDPICRRDETCVFPKVKAGFYTQSSAPMKPYHCFSNPDACLGMWPEACPRDRSGLLCLTCPAAHYRSGKTCTACSLQIPLLILLCVVFFVGLGVMHKVVNTPLTTKLSVANVATCVFSTAFTSLQLFGLFSSVDMDLSGGNSGISGFVQGLYIFMLSPNAFRLECIFTADIGQYTLQAVFFPVVCLVVLCFSFISRVSPRLRVDGVKMVNTVLTVNQAFLISFANLSLLAFQCFDHFDGASTLIQYPQQFCFDNDHSLFILLSLWMMLTVILPFNVFFVYAVFKVHALKKKCKCFNVPSSKIQVIFPEVAG